MASSAATVYTFASAPVGTLLSLSAAQRQVVSGQFDGLQTGDPSPMCSRLRGTLSAAPAGFDFWLFVFSVQDDKEYADMQLDQSKIDPLNWAATAFLGDDSHAFDGLSYTIQLVMMPTAHDAHWPSGARSVNLPASVQVIGQVAVHRSGDLTSCTDPSRPALAPID